LFPAGIVTTGWSMRAVVESELVIVIANAVFTLCGVYTYQSLRNWPAPTVG
jgi:hypothetical protein